MGYKNKIGIMIDVAASFYYNNRRKKFIGLFSEDDKTRDKLIDMYNDIVSTYPIVILEDPLDEEDFEGHAILTKELGIEVVGDDIFGTSLNRFQKGIEMGSCNSIVLKVNRMRTVSDAVKTAQLAYRSNYGVMLCSSRGLGEAAADFAVGLDTGQMKGGSSGRDWERLLQIAKNLGSRSCFAGRDGLRLHSSTSN